MVDVILKQELSGLKHHVSVTKLMGGYSQYHYGRLKNFSNNILETKYTINNYI